MPPLEFWVGIATGVTAVVIAIYVQGWAYRYRHKVWKKGMARRFSGQTIENPVKKAKRG